MVNPQLIAYVNQLKQAGYTEAQIRQSLAQRGYPILDIEAAFAPLEAASSKTSTDKRPSLVWMYSAGVFLSLAYFLVSNIFLFFTTSGLPKDKLYPVLIFFIAAIPLLIFLYNFFMLQRKAILWMLISFGIIFLANVVGAIMAYTADKSDYSWIYALVIALFGYVMWDYITNKKVDDAYLFN